MRAKWLICLLALGVATLASARATGAEGDANDPALRRVPPPAGEMLKRFLLDQARQQFIARRQAIAAIKTPEDVARRQKDMRSFLLRSLGDLPERTPLNPQVVGTLTRKGYRVDKVIF